ncbi:hypothetical protein CDD81_2596 [Ophiocordyceps australis]|uniref:Uncharacterized protein n=1 Tax=Ophiocordyceps australis TaxID=1399860 RepID=A0A2C5XEK4_9HYPO|nr:hypothetical protein CDD81_2596 [Ophiocordyceps australis]
MDAALSCGSSSVASSLALNASPAESASTPATAPSEPPTGLGQLDLGPPGYLATLTLYPGTLLEKTVHLGPWSLASRPRRVEWQGSYAKEKLEHYLPQLPADTHPSTLHSSHRPYHPALDMECLLSFALPQRLRYTSETGSCIHDSHVCVRYDFSSPAASLRFQSDVRAKELVAYYDINVAWSDLHRRTPGFGNVKGFATIQRLKLWRDFASTRHSLTLLANQAERTHREYSLDLFEPDLQNVDPRALELRLHVRNRPGSAPCPRRSSIALPWRPRTRSADAAPSHLDTPPLDIGLVGIQFSSHPDFDRFVHDWRRAHSLDNAPYPPNHAELP